MKQISILKMSLKKPANTLVPRHRIKDASLYTSDTDSNFSRTDIINPRVRKKPVYPRATCTPKTGSFEEASVRSCHYHSQRSRGNTGLTGARSTFGEDSVRRAALDALYSVKRASHNISQFQKRIGIAKITAWRNSYTRSCFFLRVRRNPPTPL